MQLKPKVKKLEKVSFKDELKNHLQKMLLGGKFKPEKLHSIPKELRIN